MEYQIPESAEEMKKYLQDILDQKDAIESLRNAYREQLPARRGFILGIIIGILGNVLVSHVADLERYYFNNYMNNIYYLLFRFIISSLILCSFAIIYYLRTKKMKKTLETLSYHYRKLDSTIEKIRKILSVE